MKVCISGASGFVGAALSAECRSLGFEVVPLVRKRGNPGIFWDPEKGLLNPEELESFDLIVHLAGENISGRRWTSKQKKRILESRVNGTSLLAQTISRLKCPPATFLTASAIGFYGSRGSTIVDESSQAGQGFLAEVCSAWERAASCLTTSGHCRLVLLRIGIVLGFSGGALGKMLLPFSLGLGGKLGTGKQYMSWISLSDVVQAILFCAFTARVSGPVNLVSPNPVTNLEFTKALGKTLKRPTIIPLPELAIRALFGEMGATLLLSSIRVMPTKILDAGFQFKHPYIADALGGEYFTFRLRPRF